MPDSSPPFTPSATAPPCARRCRQEIIDGMAALGTDVNASHVRPLFDRGYEPLNMRCPHGVLWFMEPTNEQVARYAEDRTP